jgi:hypothetical protein
LQIAGQHARVLLLPDGMVISSHFVRKIFVCRESNDVSQQDTLLAAVEALHRSATDQRARNNMRKCSGISPGGYDVIIASLFLYDALCVSKEGSRKLH